MAVSEQKESKVSLNKETTTPFKPQSALTTTNHTNQLSFFSSFSWNLVRPIVVCGSTKEKKSFFLGGGNGERRWITVRKGWTVMLGGPPGQRQVCRLSIQPELLVLSKDDAFFCHNESVKQIPTQKKKKKKKKKKKERVFAGIRTRGQTGRSRETKTEPHDPFFFFFFWNKKKKTWTSSGCELNPKQQNKK